MAIDWGGAEVTSGVPARADVAEEPAQALRTPATAYALAQGVRHHADGSAWWWLADEATPGRAKIVWYNGTILEGGVAEEEAVVGVRPMVRLDLNQVFFTRGTGTAEDPFRVK